MSERSTQPLRDESSAARAANRARRTIGIVAGIVVGAIAAVLIMWLSDSIRVTGSDRSALVIIFGVPIACVVVGAVIGALLAGSREAEVVDAPVRSEVHARAGRAATSAEGQLPGSSVPPRVERDEPPPRP